METYVNKIDPTIMPYNSKQGVIYAIKYVILEKDIHGDIVIRNPYNEKDYRFDKKGWTYPTSEIDSYHIAIKVVGKGWKSLKWKHIYRPTDLGYKLNKYRATLKELNEMRALIKHKKLPESYIARQIDLQPIYLRKIIVATRIKYIQDILLDEIIVEKFRLVNESDIEYLIAMNL